MRPRGQANQGFFGTARGADWSFGTQTIRQFSLPVVGSHSLSCRTLSVNTVGRVWPAATAGEADWRPWQPRAGMIQTAYLRFERMLLVSAQGLHFPDKSIH
jgi:hypothetical protein